MKNALLLTLLIPVLCSAQIPDTFKIQIEKYLEDLPLNTQMAFGIIHGEERLFYGVQKNNDKVDDINNADSLFQIGSITKVFTSTLLAEGIVHLNIDPDQPLRKNKLLEVNKKVNYTFKQLSNHTSGLMRLPSDLSFNAASILQPYENYSMADLHAYVLRKPQLLSAPGENYSYSNLGAAILGMEMATLFKKPYQALVDSLVFDKYNMNSSSFDSYKGLVDGLNASGKAVKPWKFDAFMSTGGAVSNTKDMLNFLQANLADTNAVLDIQRLETFEVSSTMSVAMGWHILKNQDGNRFYWHNGATNGYSSSMVLDRINNVGIICLTNVSGTSEYRQGVDLLTFELLSLFR